MFDCNEVFFAAHHCKSSTSRASMCCTGSKEVRSGSSILYYSWPSDLFLCCFMHFVNTFFFDGCLIGHCVLVTVSIDWSLCQCEKIRYEKNCYCGMFSICPLLCFLPEFLSNKYAISKSAYESVFLVFFDVVQ